MKSHLTSNFRASFRNLPPRIQKLARKNYKLWKSNPFHPSLQFKLIRNKYPTYSVRIGIGWRALGVKDADTIIWFWIGSHANYEKLIHNM